MSKLTVQCPRKEEGGKKKINRAGEVGHDEPLMDPDRAFEINVHYRILDTALEARFMTHGTLFADLAWLDPRSFEEIWTTTVLYPTMLSKS